VTRRTRLSDLAIAFVVALALVYLLLQTSYESLPPFQWFTAVPLAALTIVEFVMANRVRGAVRHRPQARPITAVSVARAVALGKASALVGVALAGAATGLAGYVLPDSARTSAAAHDLRVAAVLLVACALLAAAGLALERAGIDPGRT
jgi:Na+/melibiose symporter-like transporter